MRSISGSTCQPCAAACHTLSSHSLGPACRWDLSLPALTTFCWMLPAQDWAFGRASCSMPHLTMCFRQVARADALGKLIRLPHGSSFLPPSEETLLSHSAGFQAVGKRDAIHMPALADVIHALRPGCCLLCRRQDTSASSSVWRWSC